jgi:hypothetical protein
MKYLKFRYRKITPEMVKEMRKMRTKGFSYIDIAKKFKVAGSTAQYWVKPEYKRHSNKRSLKNSKKQLNAWQRDPEYMKEYLHDRYHNDPIFREKCLKRVRRNNAILRKEGRTWDKLHPIKFRRMMKENRRRKKHIKNKK